MPDPRVRSGRHYLRNQTFFNQKAAASGYSLSQLLNRAIDNFIHDEAPIWVHEAQREGCRVSPAKPKAAKVAKASKSVPESRVTPEQLQATNDAFGKLMEHVGDWLAADMYSFDAIGETTGRGFNPLRNSIDAQIKYLDEVAFQRLAETNSTVLEELRSLLAKVGQKS